MGNSVLIRQGAEMTHLQSNLGDTRVFSNLIWEITDVNNLGVPPSPLYHTQLVKEEKVPLKTLRGSGPIKISPFVVPTTTEKRLLQKTSLGGQSDPMTLSLGVRFYQYLDYWLIRAPSQEEAKVNTQIVVDLTSP